MFIIVRICLTLQAIESEIIAHEPLIETVATSAQDMVKSNHFEAAKVELRINDLLQKLQQLKECSSLRKIKLQDSMEAQKVKFSFSLFH